MILYVEFTNYESSNNYGTENVQSSFSLQELEKAREYPYELNSQHSIGCPV